MTRRRTENSPGNDPGTEQTETQTVREVTRKKPLKVLLLCKYGDFISRIYINELKKLLGENAKLFKFTEGGVFVPDKQKIGQADVIYNLLKPIEILKEKEGIDIEEKQKKKSIVLIVKAVQGGALLYESEDYLNFERFFSFLKSHFQFPPEFYKINFDEK